MRLKLNFSIRPIGLKHEESVIRNQDQDSNVFQNEDQDQHILGLGNMYNVSYIT